MGGNKERQFCLNADFQSTFWDLLHAENLRHGTHAFTFLPKEGVLRIFPPLKIRRLRPGLNLRTWVKEASTLTPRPPKPLLLNLLDFKEVQWMCETREQELNPMTILGKLLESFLECEAGHKLLHTACFKNDWSLTSTLQYLHGM
jgi:hypothetical protein